MNILSKYLESQRLKIVSEYIMGDVLDLGCGNAKLYSIYAKKINKYVGVDFNKEVIKVNKKQYPKANFYYTNLNRDSLRLSKKFDVILMVALVEHIFDQNNLFRQALRHLKRGGKIIITTPTLFGNDIIHANGSKLGLFSKEASDEHIFIYNKNRFKMLARMFHLKITCYKKFELGLNQLVILKNNAIRFS